MFSTAVSTAKERSTPTTSAPWLPAISMNLPVPHPTSRIILLLSSAGENPVLLTNSLSESADLLWLSSCVFL